MTTTVPTPVAHPVATHDPTLRAHRAAVELSVHLNHGWNVDSWVDAHEPGSGAARLVIGDHLDVSIYGTADELDHVASLIAAAAAAIREAQS